MATNENYLSDWVKNLKIEDLHKNHVDFIALIGLMFFCIHKLRLSLLRKTLGVFYRVAKNNDAFMRTAQNFIVVILRMIEEKVPLQKRTQLYEEIWPVFFTITGWGVKYLYTELYQEMGENKEVRKIMNIFIRRVEILSRYFTKDCLSAKDIPDCYISDEEKPTRLSIITESCQDLI